MASVAFKVLGVMGMASYAAAYVCTRLRCVSYKRVKLIAVAARGLPAMPRGYRFCELGQAELAAFAIDVGPQVQAERFASGLTCLGVFDRKDALVGVCWLARGAYRDTFLDVRFVLPEGAAWDMGLWVPEDKRMSRAFAAVWAAIGHWLHREGLQWSLSHIADYNVASILSHRRLGAIPLGHVAVLCLGRWQVTLGARPILSNRRAAMPETRLRLPPQALSHSTCSACRPWSM